MSAMEVSAEQRGVALLEDPITNKGTAFGAEERQAAEPASSIASSSPTWAGVRAFVTSGIKDL
jgi:hypothetical protein